jgi:hypothetical protein
MLEVEWKLKSIQEDETTTFASELPADNLVILDSPQAYASYDECVADAVTRGYIYTPSQVAINRVRRFERH